MKKIIVISVVAVLVLIVVLGGLYLYQGNEATKAAEEARRRELLYFADAASISGHIVSATAKGENDEIARALYAELKGLEERMADLSESNPFFKGTYADKLTDWTNERMDLHNRIAEYLEGK